MKYFLNGFLFVIRFSPKWWLVFVASFVAKLATYIPNKEAKKIKKNLAYTDFSKKISQNPSEFVFGVFYHQLLMFFEVIKYSYSPSSLQIDGYSAFESELSNILEQKKGVIIATAHLGCWELVGSLTAKAHKKPFYALAKAPERLEMFQALDAFRDRIGVVSIWNNKPNFLKQMLKTLKEGSPLGFVMDQKPQNRQGIEVDFFDIPTPFVSGPYKVGSKFLTPILAVYCIREKPFHYNIAYQKVVSSEDYAGYSESHLTQLLATSIENQIRSNPEQWAWNYKRWKF